MLPAVAPHQPVIENDPLSIYDNLFYLIVALIYPFLQFIIDLIIYYNCFFFLFSVPVITVINLEEEILDVDDFNIGDDDPNYSWSGFHFMVSLACLYLLMVLVDLSTYKNI